MHRMYAQCWRSHALGASACRADTPSARNACHPPQATGPASHRGAFFDQLRRSVAFPLDGLGEIRFVRGASLSRIRLLRRIIYSLTRNNHVRKGVFCEQ